MTHILLLLPVPKSIMMCLLLELDGSQPNSLHTIPGYEPIEEHHGARVVQLVHLQPWVAWVSQSTGRTTKSRDRRALLKSGTSVMSQR